MIKFKQLSIPDVILIEPQVFKDERGYFFESFNQKEFEKVIQRKISFVQDNQSYSTKGVLRGLHAQNEPYEQAKLVRSVEGEIFDVAVDIRKSSKTYGKWVGEIISSENKNMLWIPEGFLHGFIVLSNYARVLYKTNSYYNPESEITVRWDDPNINIQWPVGLDLKISQKDLDGNFI